MADILLHIATFIAAFAQAVTGIGFGMIAGPVILVVLEDAGAVVISTAMSWLIALVLWPMLRRGTDWRMVARLMAGAALGVPLGLAVLWALDIKLLKLFAGLAIGTLTLMMLVGAPGTRTPGLPGDLAFGGLGGLFGASLAMPGPPAALRMSGLGRTKVTVRATVVSFFCCIWPVVMAGQALTLGISGETALRALSLVPATLAGILIGNWAAGRVSEAAFRRMVLGFLMLTSLSLLGNAAWTLGGT